MIIGFKDKETERIFIVDTHDVYRLRQCSIRINKQYRICFCIDEDFNLYDVEIIDYH